MAKSQPQPTILPRWAGPLIFEPIESNLGDASREVKVSRAATPEGWLYRIDEWAIDPNGNRVRHLATSYPFVPKEP
jgi:hypothetical protein